jgi:Asp/Glu/hydantoin racemase
MVKVSVEESETPSGKPVRKANENKAIKRPIIGMLCWEAGFPLGLAQLGELPGNATNPATFNFPVRYERVRGANIHTIVEKPSVDALGAMIKAAKGLEKEGIRAITTSCGFNALFQTELANSVNIPVFTSSLLQAPMVYRMLRKGQKIGIITARKLSLTDKHLAEMGIDRSIPICIEGLENTGEWDKIHDSPDKDLDLRKLEKQIIQVANQMIERKNDIGAIVLECTDLPPFANALQQTTNLPVFDIVTLVNMVYEAIARKRYERPFH